MMHTAKSEFEVPSVAGKKGGNVLVPFGKPFLTAPHVIIENFDTGEQLGLTTKIMANGVKFWGVPPGRYRVTAVGEI